MDDITEREIVEAAKEWLRREWPCLDWDSLLGDTKWNLLDQAYERLKWPPPCAQRER